MLEDIKSAFRKGSLFTKLIYINVAFFIPVWFIDIFFHSFLSWISVPGTFAGLLYKPWTLITYMFAHSGFIHLIFNMLWLFWFGKMFTAELQQKQLISVYLLGGLVGALFHLSINQLLPPAHRAGIIGSSGAVMAVVFAVAAYKPDKVMNLVFIGEVKLKYIVAVVFFLDLMGAASSMKTGLGGIAHIAHLGGAFLGIWFGYEMRKNAKDITKGFSAFLDTVFSWFQPTSGKKNKSFTDMKITKSPKAKKQKPKSDWEFNESKADNQEEINRILEKISATGYESLSKKEKDFLFKQKK